MYEIDLPIGVGLGPTAPALGTDTAAPKVLAPALAGYASSAADITPADVSSVQYQSYTCQQLALEAQQISTRAATLSGTQDSQRTKDGVATAAAIVIFWPAAFFVGGDKQTAAGLAKMKGQMVAVEQASIAKKCNIPFQGTSDGGTVAEPESPPPIAQSKPRAKSTPRAPAQAAAAATPTPQQPLEATKQ
ncbi:hypothetical protein LRP30_25090 [Bradyrhizobium sp. C-145]|uniref:hypothetical protein n=1 Tax=Bradyrhizobium sp. C-145 TaxID=574727 RepID=UPI00201B8A4F|nr:hypothetical protein [Bradyrhizobium sp. C-145]UQR60287.1 hypothetical protein LRP30_25090 [Bradyrhizobium sp. C-145]